MRIEQLYYFLETARCGSYSKAADNLFIKQPSLRESINTLENEIGVKLFHTSNKGVTLTNYGAKCVIVFQKIISLYESVKINSQNCDERPLTIGIDLYVNELYKKNANDTLLNSSPQAHKHILFQDANTCLDNLLNGTLDLAILLLPHDNYFDLINTLTYTRMQKTLTCNLIKKVPFYMVTVKNHPLWRLNNFTSKDLQDYQLIVPEFLQYTFWKYSDVLNVNLDFQISDIQTQTNKMFLLNAISISDAYSAPTLDYSKYPNVIKIDISDLFSFGIYVFYPSNICCVEEIAKISALLKSENS
ncbi:MAG: LysR family transcriptional regulator [Peptococcaceae bacterium]|nr:LysR family transcriptional regulator [Peptococcaceae bacterium]